MSVDSFILRSLIGAVGEEVIGGAPKPAALDQTIEYGGRGAAA
jgi:hypothetical protein